MGLWLERDSVREQDGQLGENSAPVVKWLGPLLFNISYAQPQEFGEGFFMRKHARSFGDLP